MIVDSIKKLVEKIDLEPYEITGSMNEILQGKATNAQVAAFLTALRMKGETLEEITAAVKLLKENGDTLNLNNPDVIDIVGTGGDGANTFNISTASAFVLAAGGVPVAKHGSRASSSKSGAADILETLGANIMLNVEENKKLLDKIGICFMFAPKYNPLMKNAADVRREIKIRTIFNCLGPLINPSGAKTQLIGVYKKDLIEPVCLAMKNLSVEKGIALYGDPGLDEASVVSKTYFAQIKDNNIIKGEFSPEDFKIKKAELKDLSGGSPKENARILKDIFSNKIKGAKKDVVALNSAIGFFVYGKTNSIEEGLNLSYNLIENESAYEKLNSFIEGTNEYLR